MPVKMRRVAEGGYFEPDGGSLGDVQIFSVFSRLGGWWADPDAGSEIERALERNINDSTLAFITATVQSSLAWQIEDGIAASIEVNTTIGGRGFPLVEVITTRPDRLDEPLRELWELTLGA